MRNKSQPNWGMHYNYFRDYDPSIGRYIESDPIGLDGGVNTYAYVDANPLMKVDLLGLFSNYGIPDIYNTNQYAPSDPDPCGCLASAIGIDTLVGAGMVIGGQPILDKRFTQAGTSLGTSPISKGLSSALPQRLPISVWAPTNKRPLATSNKLGRVMGRWVPFAGWGLLAADVADYSRCIKNCIDEDQCKIE